MTMKTSKLTDHFLIAMPSLEDGNFSQSVTYMCEHTDEGALGITINRPSEILLSEIFEQLSIEVTDESVNSIPVYIGGPVNQDRGFILHSPVGEWKSSMQVTEQIAITTSQDMLEAIARGEGPQHMLFALGYAGWGAGQLEQEMAENAWLSCPATPQIIFNTPVESRWESAAKLLGIDLQLLSNQTGHA